MSFRIPSLDEARKKQEGRQKSSAAHSTGACTARSKPVGQQSSGRRGANSGHKSVGVQGSEQKRALTKVVNPYAKKKKEVPAAATARVAFQPERKTSPFKGGQHHPNITTSQPVAASASKVLKPIPVVDLGPIATFGEAFGSVEGTEHYENELRSLRNSDGKGIRTDKGCGLRAEQRAVDARAALSAAQEVHSSSNSGSDVRDNHALLQPHVLHVSTKQQGNAVLRHIRNVPFTFAEIVPDYIMGPNRCALFLSLRYHSLHPGYIHRRISELRTDFDLRVLLCLVDVEDNAAALLVLNKLSVVNNMTLILAWSDEEAARYLETFKAYESKDASSIQKREKETFSEQVADVLSAVRSINKTDSAQLLSQYGSLRNLIAAPMDGLSLCPGIGEKKVKRLYDAFHKPFSSKAVKKRREKLEKLDSATGSGSPSEDGDDNKKTSESQLKEDD